jgi:ParB/RepB/Spo0J family partition protein
MAAEPRSLLEVLAPEPEPAPALPDDSARNEPNSYFYFCAIDEIAVDGRNPRRHFDEGALAELAASIREHGILEPLVVREVPPDAPSPRAKVVLYSLIAGERRLRAAKLAGLDKVPVRVLEGITAREALELALVENLQREDLDPLEEASGYKALRETGLKEREIAERVHKSQPAVANRLRLLNLPEDVRERIRQGELTAAHGVALARFGDYPAIASKLSELALSRRYTSKQLEDGIVFPWELEQAGLTRRIDFRAAFDWQAVCPKCPHYRSDHGGYCLDPAGYERKQLEAHAARDSAIAAKVEEAKASGGPELVTLQSLGNDSMDYHRIYNGKVPPGCKLTECPCYAEALDYGGNKVPVCTDVKCWRRLETAATRAVNKATKADVADKLKREIPEAVARIAAPVPTRDCVLSSGEIFEPLEPPPITSRELAVLAFYALREIGGTEREALLQGVSSHDWAINHQKVLLSLAALPPAALVAKVVEAILRAEQAGRLKDYSQIGTHASEFYLGDTAPA